MFLGFNMSNELRWSSGIVSSLLGEPVAAAYCDVH